MNHILTIIIVVINHQIPLNHHFPAGFPMVFAMNLPQERTFDPVLGRYRDGKLESQQRCAEERERVAHLNRAKDIQILREQPFNILSQDWIIYII